MLVFLISSKGDLIDPSLSLLKSLVFNEDSHCSDKFLILYNTSLRLSMVFISLLILANKLFACILPTINLTLLPYKGVKIFSCPPASNRVSVITDAPVKPIPVEPTWHLLFQQYNNLVDKLANWLKGEFITLKSFVQNLLIP